MHKPTIPEALALFGVIVGVVLWLIIGAALAPLSPQR